MEDSIGHIGICSKKNEKELEMVQESHNINKIETLYIEEGDILEGITIEISKYDYVKLYILLIDEEEKRFFVNLISKMLFNQNKDNVFIENISKISSIYILYRDIINIDSNSLNILGRLSSILPQVQVTIEYFEGVEKEDIFKFMKLYYDMDAVSSGILHTGPKGYVPKELRDTVKNKGYVPEKFWYWDEESSILWKKLTNEEAYLFAEISRNLLHEAMEEVPWILARGNKYSSVDFVDLGVGTPQKDEIVLRGFDRYFESIYHGKNKGTISYYPVDISFPLLEYTLRWVLALESQQLQNTRLEIFPLIGDFDNIKTLPYQTLLRGKSEVKVISLLGNTLGNLNEIEFLRGIETLMDNNSYLLIDAEFHDNVKEEKIKGEYDHEAMYDFVFHPLELLGYKKGDYTKKFDVKLFDQGYIMWNKKIRNILMPLVKQLSTIPHSKTVAMFYKEKKDSKILLAWSTKYSRDSFEKTLQELGFDIVNNRPWRPVHSEFKDRYALYLLKKREIP